jgi:hypothetical protein
MLTIISIALLFLFVRRKKNVRFYLILNGFGLTVFSTAIDGNYFGLWDSLYDYHSVENTVFIYYYWLVAVIAQFVFFLTIKNHAPNETRIGTLVTPMRVVAKWITICSIGACVFNYSRVGSIELMFEDARAWEALFGSNVFVNYLYFTHLLALVIYGVIVGQKKVVFVDKIAIFALLFSSLLHGIKFTIIHAFIFFTFAIYLSHNGVFKKKMVLYPLGLILIIGLFFEFVRGQGVESVWFYIMSASVNSMHIINTTPLIEISNISIFNPLGFIPFEKLSNRVFGETTFEGRESGFVLNEKFNLEHAITAIGYGFGVGTVVYSGVFAVIINKIRLTASTNFHQKFLLIIVMDTLLFQFTGFEFYKTKLWFNLFISMVIYSVFFGDKFRRLMRFRKRAEVLD